MRTCLSVMIELSDIGGYWGCGLIRTLFSANDWNTTYICKSHRIYVAGNSSTEYRGLGDDFTLPPSPLTNLLITHGFSSATPSALWYLQLNRKEWIFWPSEAICLPVSVICSYLQGWVSVVHECLLCGTLDSNISQACHCQGYWNSADWNMQFTMISAIYLLLKLKMEMSRIKSSMKDCAWVG